MKDFLSLLFGLSLVVMLLALPLAAQAGDPDPDNSYAEWRDTAGGSGTPLICPGGDASYVFVRLRDSGGLPVVGRYVTLDTAPMYGCNACRDAILCEGYTDSNGEVVFVIRNGYDRSDNTSCCDVWTAVHSNEVEIRFIDSGAHDDVRKTVSVDLNGDCEVSDDDEAIFLSDFSTSACRSDFNADGMVAMSDWGIFSIHYGHSDVSGVGEDKEPHANTVRVSQGNPNPFRNETVIELTSEARSKVTARIHDVMGRHVCTVLDGDLEAGTYRIVWNGSDAWGGRVGSGLYFCRVECASGAETRRIVLLE
jgi:hypothetical protein